LANDTHIPSTSERVLIFEAAYCASIPSFIARTICMKEKKRKYHSR